MCTGRLFNRETLLWECVCDAVLSSFDTSKTKVDEYMAKYLKNAPERLGSSGRKKYQEGKI